MIESGSTASRILCSLSQPQGWFTQGVIEFLDGGNAGLKRTIRLHESGALLLTLPFRFPELRRRDNRSRFIQDVINVLRYTKTILKISLVSVARLLYGTHETAV